MLLLEMLLDLFMPKNRIKAATFDQICFQSQFISTDGEELPSLSIFSLFPTSQDFFY
jgi:hypothetical protein